MRGGNPEAEIKFWPEGSIMISFKEVKIVIWWYSPIMVGLLAGILFTNGYMWIPVIALMVGIGISPVPPIRGIVHRAPRRLLAAVAEDEL